MTNPIGPVESGKRRSRREEISLAVPYERQASESDTFSSHSPPTSGGREILSQVGASQRSHVVTTHHSLRLAEANHRFNRADRIRLNRH